jgi:hypothetical protein
MRWINAFAKTIHWDFGIHPAIGAANTLYDCEFSIAYMILLTLS